MLKVSSLSVAYGGLQALAGVSLDVAEGEFVTIVGPNGAGKTTLLRALSGAVAASAGRIEYRGRDIAALPSHARARLGIAHVPEGRRVFPSLTVFENLEMGSYRADARRHRADGLELVFALFPILRERRQQLGSSLSGGEQQMLAIGRGIMAQPDLLLLDEPSQGLGPRIVEGIFEAIAAIRRSSPGDHRARRAARGRGARAVRPRLRAGDGPRGPGGRPAHAAGRLTRAARVPGCLTSVQ